MGKEELEALKDVVSRMQDDKTSYFYENKARDRLLEVNFNILRRMAHQDVLINAIIKKRCDQIKPFIKMPNKSDTRGFRVMRKDGEIDKKAEELQEFFMNTGFGYDQDREDDLMDVSDMILRDILTIDQTAIEIRRTKKGNLFDFWVLDGATIKRTNDSKYKYIQVIDTMYGQQEVARYTNDDLIFDYINKRSDIRYRGYGYSFLEQTIDVITTFLFGMSYNRDLFIKDKVPRGFIKVMGEASASTISLIQRYWKNQMQGYGAKFKIPVLPSGKDGVGLDFQKLSDSNKDMEYHKLMQMIMSLKAAVFGIDLAELGIKSDDSQAIIGESGEPRIQHSKDSGLSSLLMFLETLYNKILRKVDINYRFEFIGIKDDDKEKDTKIKKDQIESFRTINEVRVEEGLEEIDEDYANVVLNSQAVQIYNQSKQAAMMGGGGGAEGSPEGEEEGEDELPEDEVPEDTDIEDEGNLEDEEDMPEEDEEKMEKSKRIVV